MPNQIIWGRSRVDDISYDRWLSYAKIRASLKASGAMIGANDLLIPAHARSLRLTLVTNNTRSFGRVQDLSIEINRWKEDKFHLTIPQPVLLDTREAYFSMKNRDNWRKQTSGGKPIWE